MAYPEGLAQMPGASVWAVMFFFMLFTVGLGSQVRDFIMQRFILISKSTNNQTLWFLSTNDRLSNGIID